MSVVDLQPSREKRLEFDLARTGPGTPMGRFMRRFWMPVMRAEDLSNGEAKPIRVMSEDFAVYRPQSDPNGDGAAQIIDYRCPHRGAMMHLGWVEGNDIRCVYHGWKFDCTGQCNEQPAEEAGFARKVRIGTYPTREFMGLIFGFFGEGAPPAFPPYPLPLAEGIIENQVPPVVPCNWLQCFENSMDEVHVAFVHKIGGSHSGIYDLPEIAAEETDWGMIRYGRRGNEERISLHYMPNCTRVIVPPMAGLESAGGWRELYLAFVPVDDEANMWFITNLVGVTGEAAVAYQAARQRYLERQAAAGSSLDLAQKVMDGKVRFADIDHPDRVRVQDFAVQAGQGKIADRSNEYLGKSDTAIILWRRIVERELRAMQTGRNIKQWTPAPSEVVPTLGF